VEDKGAKETHSPHRPKLTRSVTDLRTHTSAKNWDHVDRDLSDLATVLSPKVPLLFFPPHFLIEFISSFYYKNTHIEMDQRIFQQINGIDTVIKTVTLEGKIPAKIISNGLRVLLLACQQHPPNIIYIIMTNRTVPLLNLLERSLSPERDSSENFLPQLLTLITLLFWQPVEGEAEIGMKIKGKLLTYAVNCGLIDLMQRRLIRMPHGDLQAEELAFIERACEFLEAISAFPAAIQYKKKKKKKIGSILH
jgi:hypothetical protein